MSGAQPGVYPYRHDIQALRGVAVLAVILFHLFPAWLPGGYAGVDVFFVISGYVVTYALLARQAQRQRPVGIGEYLARRIRRIYPPLVVCIGLIALATFLIYDKRLFHSFSGYSLTSLLGVSNLKLIFEHRDYFSPDEYLNPYLHAWSLGIEEQFYLLYPLLFLPMLGSFVTRPLARPWAGLLAALTAASLISCALLSLLNPQLAYLSPLSRFWELAAGVLLCLALESPRYRQGLQLLASRAVGPICLGILLLSFWGLSDKGWYPWPGILWPVAASLGLLASGALRGPGWLGQAPGLGWWGRRSYSLYLYHWPCIVFSRYLFGESSGLWLPVAIVSTLLLSIASYRFVEQRFCRTLSLRRLAVFCTGGFAGLLLLDSQAAGLRQLTGLARFSELAWKAEDPRPLQQLLGPQFQGEAQAQRQESPALALTLIRSPQRPLGASQRLFVLGDSHGGSLVGALRVVVAAKPQLEALVISPPGLGGCSLVSYSFDPSRCIGYERAALALVQRQARPGDLLLLPSLRLPRLAPRLRDRFYQDLRRPLAGPEFAPGLRALGQRGVHAYLLAPWPVYNVLGKQCLGWQGRLKPDCQLKRATFEAERQLALQRMHQFQALVPGLGILDPLPFFCGAELCSISAGPLPLYADHDHLSAYGSARLGQWLLQQKPLLDLVEYGEHRQIHGQQN